MQPDANLCPQVVKEAFARYVQLGVPPGDFVRAVLENQLKQAIMAADDGNRDALVHIVAFAYNELPHICWGSAEKVRAWLDLDWTKPREEYMKTLPQPLP